MIHDKKVWKPFRFILLVGLALLVFYWTKTNYSQVWQISTEHYPDRKENSNQGM